MFKLYNNSVKIIEEYKMSARHINKELNNNNIFLSPLSIIIYGYFNAESNYKLIIFSGNQIKYFLNGYQQNETLWLTSNKKLYLVTNSQIFKIIFIIVYWINCSYLNRSFRNTE